MADINLGVGGANSAVAGGYDIANSLKLEQDNTEYLHKTPTSSGNRRTFTLSAWIKRTEIERGSGGGDYIFTAGDGDYNKYDRTILKFNHDDTIYWGGGDGYEIKTNRVFRDTSAWYHIAMIVDTTSGTAGDRLKLYVNGVRETSFSSSSNPSQNFDYAFMKDDKQVIGYNHTDSSNPMSAYIAEVLWLDGTAASITDLGEFDADTGIWIPKDVSGLSVGTNGCYLDFKDASNLGNDASGGTDFTLNNITSADQATDTPTNNFCTINPLIPYNGSVSEGATKFIHTSGGNGWESFVATMGAGTSGKWYAEFKFVDSDNDNMIGICPIDDPDLNRGGASFAYYGSDSSLDESVGYYASDGNRYIGGGPASYGNSYARTNIMSIAVDMDNGKLYFAKDGVWQNSGDPTSGATGTGALDVRGATKPQSLGASNYYSGEDILANYGGFTTISISTPETDENGYGTFEYAPPSGYYALCTKNLAEYG